jgi:peptidoglycan/xylan/chitin deacetylase (PgdA/CDA1 family)
MMLSQANCITVGSGIRPRATKLSEVLRAGPLKNRLRYHLRFWAGQALSLTSRLPERDDWIFILGYHMVFDDERKYFARLIKAMRGLGEFISLDDAAEAIKNPAGVRGRYFCVTFDDGFKNCFANAFPILLDARCPAAFFLPTDYIGLDLDRDWDRVSKFYNRTKTYRLPMEFMSWDDCRTMRKEGMIFGSHTCSHVALASLSPAEAERELRESKQKIESELGGECRHFCAPWGMPGDDFDPQTHPVLAKKIGYRSFVSSEFGYNRALGELPYLRRRDMCGDDNIAILRFGLDQCRKLDAAREEWPAK